MVSRTILLSNWCDAYSESASNISDIDTLCMYVHDFSVFSHHKHVYLDTYRALFYPAK